MPSGPAPQLDFFPLLAGIDNDMAHTLRSHLKAQSFSRGQLLFEQGSDGDDIYFIISGELIVLTYTMDGREIIFEHANPGSYLGEIAALDDSPRTLSVYARADTEALLLPKQVFLDLIDRDKTVRNRLIRDLIKRIRTLTERSYEATVYSVEDRVRVRLSRLFLESNRFEPGGVLDNAPTHEEIANRIGANREAVSRSLSKLKRTGIINTGRQQLVILQPDALLDGLI